MASPMVAAEAPESVETCAGYVPPKRRDEGSLVLVAAKEKETDQGTTASGETTMVLSSRSSDAVGIGVPQEVKECLADLRAKAKAFEETSIRLGHVMEPAVEVNANFT